jgi:hypothetical protein
VTLRALALSVVSAGWALAVACGTASAEEQTLLRFFTAARTLDSTLIAKYATVGFNPRSDGIVQTFTVTEAGQDRDGRKNVTIEAVIREPAGTTVQRTLIVTFQTREGRPIIIALRQVPTSRTSREASSVRPS